MYNPMYYLLDYYEGYPTSTVAPYWRIHTGIEQGDRTGFIHEPCWKVWGGVAKAILRRINGIQPSRRDSHLAGQHSPLIMSFHFW
jgi:hypothetical protein